MLGLDFNNIVDTMGVIASGLVLSSFLPQIYRAAKTRRMKDVSVYLILMLLIGFSLWIIYGILRNDLIIIGSNVTNASLNAILLILKFKYERNSNYTRRTS
jgi:MtN3 and saliva related transmembrane protein